MPEIDQEPSKTNVVTGDGCLRCCKIGALNHALDSLDILRNLLSTSETVTSEAGSGIGQAAAQRKFGDSIVAMAASLAPAAGGGKIYTTEAGSDFGKLLEKPVRFLQRPGAPSGSGYGEFFVGKRQDVQGRAFTSGGAPIIATLFEFGLLMQQSIGFQQGFVYGLATATDALGELSTPDRMFGGCEECCKKRLLSQSKPRKLLTQIRAARIYPQPKTEL